MYKPIIITNISSTFSDKDSTQQVYRVQGDIVEGFFLHNVSSGLDYLGQEHH